MGRCCFCDAQVGLCALALAFVACAVGFFGEVALIRANATLATEIATPASLTAHATACGLQSLCIAFFLGALRRRRRREIARQALLLAMQSEGNSSITPLRR